MIMSVPLWTLEPMLRSPGTHHELGHCSSISLPMTFSTWVPHHGRGLPVSSGMLWNSQRQPHLRSPSFLKRATPSCFRRVLVIFKKRWLVTDGIQFFFVFSYKKFFIRPFPLDFHLQKCEVPEMAAHFRQSCLDGQYFDSENV